MELNNKMKNKNPANHSSSTRPNIIKSKKAQEEMIGFALIIVIMAVVILVLFSLTAHRKTGFTESYEADNFVQAMLQQTTNCSVDYDSNILDIRKLVKSCNSQEICLNSESACEVLNQTMKEIMSQSWQVGPAWQYKGYEISVDSSDNQTIFYELAGNKTNNFKGANQVFDTYSVDLKIYS